MKYLTTAIAAAFLLAASSADAGGFGQFAQQQCGVPQFAVQQQFAQPVYQQQFVQQVPIYQQQRVFVQQQPVFVQQRRVFVNRGFGFRQRAFFGGGFGGNQFGLINIGF